ncbi:MAG: GNAT family N-acetyltransferase [Rubrobacteraceae bacterium]
MAHSASVPSPGEVVLRGVIEDDLPVFFEHQQDPDATRMAAFPARSRDAFMAHWARILDDETVVNKTILFDGKVAGSILSFEQSGEREVGYWIGREFWGRGVATNALSEFLAHVRQRPLYAHVAGHNVASVRVLEKCGFVVFDKEREFSSVHGKEIGWLILKLEA